MSELKVEYVHHAGSDLTVANAARISVGRESEALTEADVRLIKYLVRDDHLPHSSPFEHCVLSVIVHCPLFIRSQIHRHRTFSYNEVSRRYTSEEIEFYEYPVGDVRRQSRVNKQGSEGTLDDYDSQRFVDELTDWQSKGLELYARWVGRGVAKEQARSFLGQNLMTRFYMTGNLWNWAKFLKLRLDAHAQRESQVVAGMIEEIVVRHWPVAYGALKVMR